MEKLINKMIVGALTVIFAMSAFSTPVSANSYRVACPFYPQANRTIVNFDTDFVWGRSGELTEVSRSVNLPAGKYNVSLSSFDGYAGRDKVSQPNESYFIALRTNTNLVFWSQRTPDLRDNVTNAQWSGTTDYGVYIPENITIVKARHSNHVGIMEGPNSVTAGCAAFDLITPADQTLNVSCSASPSSVNIGQTVSWASNVSGGNGSYNFSWTGTDGLYAGNVPGTSKSYTSAGTKTATVTVTSGSQSVTKSCNTVVNPPQTQNLTGSCNVSPSAVNIGGSLNWNSTASGGTGSYNYSWTGTDGLSGNSSAVSKSYSSAGTKTGTVTITSGSQSVSYSCNGTVNQVVTNNLNVSCNSNVSSSHNGEGNINWYSNVSGGTGSYNYSWTGTDGLFGNNSTISKYYNNDGRKYAYLTVTSGTQTAQATCSEDIEDDNDNLRVSCYANPTNIQTGQQMNWYANVSGGDGDYDYDWDGDDGLNSSSRSPSKIYYNAGTKEAEVTVRDGDGNRDTDTCTVRVNQNTVLAFSQVNQTPYQPAVYLSQVPYTGVKEDLSILFFVLGLALFSAYVAYVVISHKKSVGEWQ